MHIVHCSQITGCWLLKALLLEVHVRELSSVSGAVGRLSIAGVPIGTQGDRLLPGSKFLAKADLKILGFTLQKAFFLPMFSLSLILFNKNLSKEF